MSESQSPLDEKLKYLKNLINSDQWEFVTEIDGNQLEKLKIPGHDIECFMGTGIVNATPGEVCKYVWDSYSYDKLHEFDPDIIYFKVIRNIDSNTRLCHQAYKLAWPCWSRDVTYVQTRKRIKDTYWIWVFSVDSDEIPENPDEFVRAIVHISGYTFVPKDKGTLVYRLTHVDPSGSIPPFVVNSFSTKTLDAITYIQKVFP